MESKNSWESNRDMEVLLSAIELGSWAFNSSVAQLPVSIHDWNLIWIQIFPEP